jgi:ABC-type proline/glycine betaine transport system ATPase subunit
MQSARLLTRCFPLNDAIIIRGARTHNLKNISCDIPHGMLTVISGVSGSGKSSLAFDTIYATLNRSPPMRGSFWSASRSPTWT